MKKSSFLLGAAALMLATACSNDEVVNVAPQSGAIGFHSFVDKSTRANDRTIADVEQFRVWGVTYGGAGNVTPTELFGGLNVDRAGEGSDTDPYTWSYQPARYWIGGNSYSFAAFAPFNYEGTGVTINDQNPSSTEAGISFTFNNKTAEASQDLLYAAAEATNVDAGRTQAVELQFKHMLSKVKFQFNNALETGTIKIVDLKINNAVEEATISAAQATGFWTPVSGKDASYVVAFATAAEAEKKVNSDAMFLIPADQELAYNVTFTIELYKDNNKIASYNHDVTLDALKYTNNYSYNFVATIDPTTIDPENQLKPITFNATVAGWDEYKEVIPGEEGEEDTKVDPNLPTQKK